MQLRRYAPPDSELGEPFEVQLEGASLDALITQLGFKLDQAKIVMINGNRVTDLNTKLSENDLVVIFPPVGGG